MKKIISSTLCFIMLSSNTVHAISNDITLSNTTLDEKIEIIDDNDIVYMSSDQVIDVKNNTEVLDENKNPIRLLGDGVTDETDKIEKLIEYAILNGRELYFPEGTYKITRDIDLSKVRLPNSSSFKISGDKNGLSIFDGTSNTEKMLKLIHGGYSGEVDKVEIENIAFNNMGLEITQRTKKEVIIKNNIFMNGNYTREKKPDGSISKATMEPYVVAKNTKYTVENNIFLRGTNYPGRGVATYGTNNTNISNNFFGALDGADDAAKMLPTEVSNRLKLIKSLNLVDDEHQGNFFTAINNERFDTNVLIMNNYFKMVRTRDIVSDFPTDVLITGINVPKEGQRRDHIIYSKCYENLDIVGNYFEGMENGHAGGVKIRNGKNVYVGSNYFSNVPLLTYVYGDLTREDSLLYDTVIYNNLLHTKNNFGEDETGILYYQSFKDGETLTFNVKDADGTVKKDVWENAYGDVQNFIIYKNSFFSDERDQITISGRANKAYENNEFLAHGNTYLELPKLVNYNDKGNYALPESSEDTILSKIDSVYDKYENYDKGYKKYSNVEIPLSPPKVDTSYVEESLDEADKFYEDIINNNLVGDLEGQYSEEATNEFKDILDKISEIINSGNLTQAEANKYLTEIEGALHNLKDSVKPMGESPVLLKVTELKINKGDTVDFMEGIYVIDNKDTKEQLDIKFDLGDFNSSKPGIYTIKYTVTDTDGNVITFTRSIEVLVEDEPTLPPDDGDLDLDMNVKPDPVIPDEDFDSDMNVKPAPEVPDEDFDSDMNVKPAPEVPDEDFDSDMNVKPAPEVPDEDFDSDMNVKPDPVIPDEDLDLDMNVKPNPEVPDEDFDSDMNVKPAPEVPDEDFDSDMNVKPDPVIPDEDLDLDMNVKPNPEVPDEDFDSDMNVKPAPEVPDEDFDSDMNVKPAPEVPDEDFDSGMNVKPDPVIPDEDLDSDMNVKPAPVMPDEDVDYDVNVNPEQLPVKDNTTNNNESSDDVTNGTTLNGNISSGNISSGTISNITTLNGNESEVNISSSISSNSTTSNVDKSNNNDINKESLNEKPINETKDENGVSSVFTSSGKMSFNWLLLLPILLIIVLLLLLKRKKEDDDSDNN